MRRAMAAAAAPARRRSTRSSRSRSTYATWGAEVGAAFGAGGSAGTGPSWRVGTRPVIIVRQTSPGRGRRSGPVPVPPGHARGAGSGVRTPPLASSVGSAHALGRARAVLVDHAAGGERVGE